MSFIGYLKEVQSNNDIVASFGRMNPGTVGHGLLVKKVIDTAKQNHCDHVIYLSRSCDPKKNPLPIDIKLAWVRKMFPGVNFKPADDSIQTFIDMVTAMNTVYDGTLYLVAGSDRVPEYQKLLDKYNGKEYQYKKIVVVSAGDRDPDADGASGMSATKMREAAAQNNLSAFRKGLPVHMASSAQRMMDDVRKGMRV